MRRRDSNQHALVPDIHSSQPMRDSDPHQLVLIVHGFGNGEQRAESEGWVGGVGEVGDGAGGEGVAGTAYRVIQMVLSLLYGRQSER